MKVNHCLAIVLGLWMIISAASDALADCGYNKLWLIRAYPRADFPDRRLATGRN